MGGGEYLNVSVVLFYITSFLQLKKEYREVKQLRDLSGFGWDDIQKLVTADNDVWLRLITVRS